MRTQKEVRQRAPAWFAALLALNFGLMVYDARDPETQQRVIRVWLQTAVAPFQQATSSVGGAGQGFFASFSNMRSAVFDNESLRLRVAELESELRNREVAVAENERLRGLLDLRESGAYETVMARVIGRDPSAWFGAVTINRGSQHGVELNMPVVTAAGVVGRIVLVSPWSAQVMLLTDERAGAGAVIGQLGASTAVGIVQGLGREGLLEMRYVSGLEKIAQGDFVLTTGQDRIYPPGLSVGTVAEVKDGTATAAHTIYVRPSAELNALRQVAVLRYRPPQRETTPAETTPENQRQRRNSE
jgi:rod shape-determining protein MreC